MRLVSLKVNQIDRPLGFQLDKVSISWKIENAEANAKAAHARIIVRQGDIILFDGKEDTDANSVDYPIVLSLLPRTRYHVTVTVTADDGTCATETSWFETGKMEESWQGKWISPELDNSIYPILEKEFVIDENALCARLYMCGLGLYEVYINGKKVGEEYLTPGYHSYDFHLQTQTYDATEYLKIGTNNIRVMMGAGWFKGRFGFDGGYEDIYGDSYHLIGELHIGLQEDRKQVIITDTSWRCKPSPIIFSNIYDGEIYDARLESENHWQKTMIKEPVNCGPLSDRYSLSIVKKEEFKPITLIHTPNNEVVLDFGQNLTGWVEFDCNIGAGQKIKLTASEIMQNECFYHENLRTAKTEYSYISNGEKAHVRPYFTFYGFRYMKVECEEPVLASAFTAYHLRSDVDQIGYITTGNEKVNQLFSNALWSQKDNSLDVPTDCPQRDERLGWTGDAQIFSDTACFNMYMPVFYRKYLWDMRAEQSILDGSVPNVVPRLKQGLVAEHGACPWADAGVIIPWNIYLHYGSKTLLEETYPGMKAWIECERTREEALGGAHLIKEGFHFADWLALDNKQPGPFGATDPLYIASAYYYRCVRILADAADALGYKADAKEYASLSREILQAIQETYFDEQGVCICNTQTGSAIAIEFGLIPDSVINGNGPEGSRLQQKVNENNGYLNTGFVGTPILCPALTKSGHESTAVDLLLNEEYPGWLYSVNLGATTIWERWNSVMKDGSMSKEGMNSLNHYCYGSIVAWMYRDICGISPDKNRPGFKKVTICPHPDRRLGFAKAVMETAAGRYISGWKYEKDESITFELEVPFDSECEVTLPKGQYVVNDKRTEGNVFKLICGIYSIRKK